MLTYIVGRPLRVGWARDLGGKVGTVILGEEVMKTSVGMLSEGQVEDDDVE